MRRLIVALVFLCGVQTAHAGDEAVLRSLLGVWKFHIYTGDEEFTNIVFVDIVRTMDSQPVAVGVTSSGLPLVAGPNPHISETLPYQYLITWEEPPGRRSGLPTCSTSQLRKQWLEKCGGFLVRGAATVCTDSRYPYL